VNRGVEAHIEFHERPGGPNRLAQLLPRHDVAGALEQQRQHAKRLLLDPDLDPVL
jgi:hypothetical protein